MLGLKDYSGNPLEAVIGPLIVDDKIQKRVNDIFEEGKEKFAVKLEGITPSIDEIVGGFPCECFLEMSKV